MRLLRSTAVILIALIVSFFFGAGHSFAATSLKVAPQKKQVTGPYNIEADLFTYERDTDTYQAQGNVIITFKGGFLKADSVTINKQTGDSWAEGNVFINSDGDILEGEVAFFNLDDKTGTLYKGKVFFAKSHMYLKGDEIEKKGEADYFLKNADATTCDGEKPAWRFKARELDVTVDGYGTIKDGSFQIKNTPVLYLPWMLFPAKTTRQSGFLFPHISYSSENGIDVEVPFFWAISESTDATFYQRYIGERGYKQGIEYRYAPSKDTFGTIYTDYIKDHKSESEIKDALTRDWQDSRNRWSYYINHETTFSPGFYFRTDLRKVSDHWYFRDFSNYNYYLENYSQSQTNRFEKVSFRGDQTLTSLDSTARLVKASGFHNFTALAQYTDDLRYNSNDATMQRYPELTFTTIRHPVFNSAFNFEMTSIYDYFYRNVGEKGHYGDISPIISRTVSFGDYAQFTPFTGVRGTFWDSSGESGTPDKQDSRTMGIVGTTASTEAFRIYDIGKGEGLEKIRHSIKPEITYTYAAVSQGDRPVYVANIDSTNQLIYSLSNYLTTRSRGKDGKPFYREVLRLKLTQSYDIKLARENTSGDSSGKEFGPVGLEADVNPFEYLYYHADAAFDQNTGDWIRSNHDVTVKDARGDSATIGYRYTKGGSLGYNYLVQPGYVTTTNTGVQTAIRELNLALKAKITKSLNLFYVLRRNEVDAVSLETTYGFEYTQQCWGMQVSYQDTTDDKRVMVIFSLTGLGKVGGMSSPVSF